MSDLFRAVLDDVLDLDRLWVLGDWLWDRGDPLGEYLASLREVEGCDLAWARVQAIGDGLRRNFSDQGFAGFNHRSVFTIGTFWWKFNLSKNKLMYYHLFPSRITFAHAGAFQVNRFREIPWPKVPENILRIGIFCHAHCLETPLSLHLHKMSATQRTFRHKTTCYLKSLSFHLAGTGRPNVDLRRNWFCVYQAAVWLLWLLRNSDYPLEFDQSIHKAQLLSAIRTYGLLKYTSRGSRILNEVAGMLRAIGDLLRERGHG